MRFLYLRDPLFLICLGLYAANRWAFELWMPRSFFTNHFNDLICIPFCVPIMLFLLRCLRLRSDDSPPQPDEILVPLILWAAVFELWLPNLPVFRGLATADYLDVFYCTLGASIAGIWWRVWYGREIGEEAEELEEA